MFVNDLLEMQLITTAVGVASATVFTRSEHTEFFHLGT